MKIIHHRLEDGMADPVEINVTMDDYQCPSDVLIDAMEYLSDAMKDNTFSHAMYGFDFTEAENHSSKVFLFTSGEDEPERAEVVVSNKPAVILDAYKKFVGPCEGDGFPCKTLHLQEYESFEQAYMVALSLREGHPLCYNQ
jgi:hypothetical protein